MDSAVLSLPRRLSTRRAFSSGSGLKWNLPERLVEAGAGSEPAGLLACTESPASLRGCY